MKITLEATTSTRLCFDVLSSSQVSSLVDVSQNLNADAKVEESIKLGIEISPSGISFGLDFVSFGNRTTVCPIIDCVDGGNAFTTAYPPINGFLKGGSA